MIYAPLISQMDSSTNSGFGTVYYCPFWQIGCEKLSQTRNFPGKGLLRGWGLQVKKLSQYHVE